MTLDDASRLYCAAWGDAMLIDTLLDLLERNDPRGDAELLAGK